MTFRITAHCKGTVPIADVEASSPEEALEIFHKQYGTPNYDEVKLFYTHYDSDLQSANAHNVTGWVDDNIEYTAS